MEMHDARFDSAEKIGAYLQEKRLSRDIGLDEVSAATGISTAVLLALENGEREKLPAEVYIRAFYKKYAAYLGIDTDEISAQYQQKKQSPKKGGNNFDFNPVVTLKGREENPFVETLRRLFLPLAIFILGIVVYLLYKNYLAPYNPLGFCRENYPSLCLLLNASPTDFFC
jgi:cytoskeletal protein RodZ